jgi:hypothetical protein
VSVVVPARNVAATVGATLDALGPQVRALGAEVVFVDDASTDGTGATVAAWAARNPEVPCTVVRAGRRRSVNGSRNAGVAFARGTFVAFCDGDDVVDPGWLRHLTAPLAPDVIVTGRVRDIRSGWIYPPSRFYGVDRPLVFGGCFAAARALVVAVGGFDEEIRAGGTESEFVLTAQLDHGATVVAADDAVIGYQLSDDRRARRRRAFQQQQGHACIARRLVARRDGTTTTFTVRHRLLGVAANLAAVVTGRGGSRRDHWDGAVTECVAIGWLVRYSLRLPPPRRADPAIRDRYTVLVAPPDAGSAVSKIRREPSP